jgi:hypothetical protein
MEQIGKRSMSTAIPQVQADKRFGRYRRVHHKRYRRVHHKMVRGIGMADDANLRRAIRVWHSFEFNEPGKAEELLVDSDFSPQDIRRFCVYAKDFEDQIFFGTKLGYQVSAMINSSSHGTFELDLDNLETSAIYLCNCNRKHVTIRGDVGQALGWRMRSGTVHLAGGARARLGEHMEGGRIIVSGDVGSELGRGMSGGLIVVKGDVFGVGPWDRGTG